MKKSLAEIIETIRKLEYRLRTHYHVSQIGVFGSVARGENTETSDVDLYVELLEPLGFEFISLGDELEDALGIKVDLADREMLKRLWPYIQEDLVYV